MKKIQFKQILKMSWGAVYDVMNDIDTLIANVKQGEIRPCAARKQYIRLIERLTHHGGRFCRILNAANDYDSQEFRDWSSSPYYTALGRYYAFFGV